METRSWLSDVLRPLLIGGLLAILLTTTASHAGLRGMGDHLAIVGGSVPAPPIHSVQGLPSEMHWERGHSHFSFGNRTLIDYLRDEIRSGDRLRLEHALMDVIRLANCPLACTVHLMSFPKKVIHVHSDPDFGNVIDVSALVPDLVWVYHTGSTDGLKLMAVAALMYIGDEEQLEEILFGAANVSEHVTTQTKRFIVGFFLSVSPDLEKSFRRTGQFLKKDLHLARARLATVPAGR